MIREYTATGATVEEAIENACRELGVSPTDVTPEILKLPKKGFFKKTPAEVRIVVQSDEELMREEPAPVKKTAAKEKAAVSPAAAPKQAPAKKEVAVPTEKPAPTPAPAPKEEKTEPKKETTAAPVQPKAPAAEPAKKEEAPISEEEMQSKIKTAEEYLSSIFEKMGLQDVQMRFEQTENRTVLIHIDGGEIGTVIGKRGETLDAIQYLVSLVANRHEGEYVRFTINAGNYREKREETLRALAQRMARKVLKTGRPVALEPMNPYERRIIHAVVTEIEGVYSKSTGEEPNRKVVIKPSGKSGASGGSRREGRPGRGNRPPRNNAPQTEKTAPEADTASSAPVEPVEEPKVDTHDFDSVKLYSKIEL